MQHIPPTSCGTSSPITIRYSTLTSLPFCTPPGFIQNGRAFTRRGKTELPKDGLETAPRDPRPYPSRSMKNSFAVSPRVRALSPRGSRPRLLERRHRRPMERKLIQCNFPATPEWPPPSLHVAASGVEILAEMPPSSQLSRDARMRLDTQPLLRCPGRRGMLGRMELQLLAATMFQHDKHEQIFHRDRGNGEELHRGDLPE